MLQSIILEPADLDASLQGQRDLGQGVGHLLLDELRSGQRTSELLALERVIAGGRQAEFGRSQRAPSDAEAGAVQTAERTFQTVHFGQHVRGGHHGVLQHDHARDRGAQREFAFDFRSR